MRQVRISFSDGAAFALEVATGEFSDGGGLFPVFDREREEVLAFLDAGGGDGGDENDGFAERTVTAPSASLRVCRFQW